MAIATRWGVIGEVVGGQRLLARLGEGGMGVVYRARDELLGRETAVKMLHPQLSQQKEIVQRFFNEARAAAALSHIGIIEVHSFGYHTDGSAFLVMELLEGESLETRLAGRGRLEVADALRITRGICSALAAAHDKRIVHRDLKPENIYLVPDADFPGGERVKILDFGIAKLAGDARPGVATRAGTVLGTPEYMAPEQCRGETDIDARADLYALGCILYRMLCGRAPFTGVHIGEILAAHMRDPPIPPRQLAPEIPPALEAILSRLLAKERGERFASAAELRAALDEAEAGTGSAAGTGTAAVTVTATATETAARRPARWGPIGLAAALVGGGVAAGAIVAGQGGDVGVLAGIAVPGPAPCSGAACVEQARRHELGGDLELDYRRAAGLYVDGCATGSVEACARAGHFFLNAVGVEYDAALGREHLRRACDDRHTGGCADLGMSLVGEHAGAAAYLERGCAGGDADACLWKIRLVPTPAGEEAALRDKARAIARERCASGVAAACATAVQTLTADSPRAEREELARLACDRDQPIGCAALPSRADRFEELVTRACDAGHGELCYRVGEHRLDMRPTEENRRRAIDLLWRACELRHPAACSRLWRVDGVVDGDRLEASCERSPAACVAGGVHYRQAGSPTRAVDLYTRGCEGGAAAGCTLAADILERGMRTVPRDADRAAALRERYVELQSAECRGDVVAGCAELGRHFEARGELDRAIEAFEKACVGADALACFELAQLRKRAAAP